MKKIENYFLIEKILTVIDFIQEDGVKKYNKSILEFNPADNNYYMGYCKACEVIKKNVIKHLTEV